MVITVAMNFELSISHSVNLHVFCVWRCSVINIIKGMERYNRSLVSNITCQLLKSGARSIKSQCCPVMDDVHLTICQRKHWLPIANLPYLTTFHLQPVHTNEFIIIIDILSVPTNRIAQFSKFHRSYVMKSNRQFVGSPEINYSYT